MRLNLWILTSWASASASAVAALGVGGSDLQQPLVSQPSKIPPLGFGTWNLDPSNVTEAVTAALQAGYRHIDCAKVYGNQRAVGKGIADGLKKTGLNRSDIWITSKLWNDQYGSPSTTAQTRWLTRRLVIIHQLWCPKLWMKPWSSLASAISTYG